MTRPERELLNGKVEGFFGWLTYTWLINSLLFWAWFEWLRTFGYLVVAYGMGKYVLFTYEVRGISGMSSEEERSVEDAID
jgi:hypothetical protein